MSEEIRQAIADRVAAKRKDKAFRARVRAVIEQNQRVLERPRRVTVRGPSTSGGYLVIAEEVLGVPADDIASSSRLDLAESALHAPAAAFGDVEFYPDLATKAAVTESSYPRFLRSTNPSGL